MQNVYELIAQANEAAERATQALSEGDTKTASELFDLAEQLDSAAFDAHRITAA